MRVVDEDRFGVLVEQGRIRHRDCSFLDGIKIGLSIVPAGLVTRSGLSAQHRAEDAFEQTVFDGITLDPQRFYLAKTIQALSLPDNLFGLIHTNSRWARIGLDCLASSSYVSPGFGADNPTPLVLELRVAVPLRDFSHTLSHLAGLVLFELERPVRLGAGNHANRFPLNII